MHMLADLVELVIGVDTHTAAVVAAIAGQTLATVAPRPLPPLPGSTMVGDERYSLPCGCFH